MSEFTGERVVPGEVEIDLWNEHASRYALARRYADGRRVVDIGCGAGYGAADLSRAATSVVALDCSEEAIGYARAHYPLANVSFLIASAAELPLASESFDLATVFEVIEHLVEWRQLLSEARRILRPDGLAIISTPNREYYAESRRLKGPNPFHHHEFDPGEFLSELSALFPHVSLLLQNRTEAITFHPAKTFSPAGAHVESGAGSASDAHFLVAFCAVRPLHTHDAFVYVPRAANVLREREQHITLLEQEIALKEGWVNEARGERDQLHCALKGLQEHLDQQNRWALELDNDLQAARARILELQDQVERTTEWAVNLNTEIEQLRTHLSETQAELEERSKWALDLDARLQLLEAQVAMARTSRWLRLGRQFKVGPAL